MLKVVMFIITAVIKGYEVMSISCKQEAENTCMQ